MISTLSEIMTLSTIATHERLRSKEGTVLYYFSCFLVMHALLCRPSGISGGGGSDSGVEVRTWERGNRTIR